MKNNKIKRDIILYIVIIVFIFGFLQINLGDPTSSTLYEIINESATFLFFYPNLEFGITGYTTAGPGQPTELKVQVCTAAINEVENNSFPKVDICDGAYPSQGIDFLGEDDINIESHSRGKGKYAGVNVTIFNSSINDCDFITSVELCQKRWASPTDVEGECLVAVDNDENDTWTIVNSTCTGASEPSAVTCTNLTSNGEDWGCNNFFGSAGSRAQAKIVGQRNSTKGPSDYNIDILYFNVIYERINDTEKPQVNLQYPANITITNSTLISWIFNTTDTFSGIENASLFTNGTNGIWQRRSDIFSVSQGINQTVYFDVGINGNYLWNVLICDSSDNKNCNFHFRNLTVFVNTSGAQWQVKRHIFDNSTGDLIKTINDSNTISVFDNNKGYKIVLEVVQKALDINGTISANIIDIISNNNNLSVIGSNADVYDDVSFNAVDLDISDSGVFFNKTIDKNYNFSLTLSPSNKNKAVYYKTSSIGVLNSPPPNSGPEFTSVNYSSISLSDDNKVGKFNPGHNNATEFRFIIDEPEEAIEKITAGIEVNEDCSGVGKADFYIFNANSNSWELVGSANSAADTLITDT